VSTRAIQARVLHLGAGRQSSCMAEMVVLGELPIMDLVVFCDTGDEPSWVYRQVDYLSARLASVGVELVVAKKRSGGLVADLQSGVGRFASIPLFTRDELGKVSRLKRQCTNEYKIEPADGVVIGWLLDHDLAQWVQYSHGPRRRRVRGGVLTEHYYGISYDEWERAGKRGQGWQVAKYPLIDRKMTTADCIGWLRDRGLPIPRRSACRICPYHDDAYWLMLQEHSPEDFAHVCRFDAWLRSPQARSGLLRNLRDACYVHRSCIPLVDVDFHAAQAAPAELCGDHCMT